MRVFVAGATGAMGRQLVPRLVQAGHRVIGMTRTKAKQELFGIGAPHRWSPTRSIPIRSPRRSAGRARGDRPPADRDRRAGPAPLRSRLRADQPPADRGHRSPAVGRAAVGVRRFVAQSYAGWPYARTGGPVKSEDDPLDPTPPREMRESLAAIRHLEEAVLGADWTEGIVLRYGGSMARARRWRPAASRSRWSASASSRWSAMAAGVWSFVHIADAAEATVAAVEHGSRGVYNVVDDDPAPVAEWLPALAEQLGAPKPMARAAVRRAAVRRRGRRGDDDRDPRRVERQGQARARLAPGHPSWRQGLRGER